MKTAFFIFIIITSFNTYSQDTIYLNNDWEKITENEYYSYYKVIKKDKQDTNIASEKIYSKSGQIIEENNYSVFSKNIKHGKYKLWYLNGKIKRDIDYTDGNINGKLLTYWENGQIKRNDTYINGKFIEGVTKNSEGEEVEHYDFEIMPVFPGGNDELYKYIKKNIKYPRRARKKGISGKVNIKFEVSSSGKVVNPIIVNGVSKELDDEAIRVVKNMPDWKPGMCDGKNVSVYFNLPINFTFIKK